uniref:Uncharacterized protein n=1 Tax=Tetraselmis sp. GSL018 TaxID=582737 RepID=A0A061QUX8_9CHLO
MTQVHDAQGASTNVRIGRFWRYAGWEPAFESSAGTRSVGVGDRLRGSDGPGFHGEPSLDRADFRVVMKILRGSPGDLPSNLKREIIRMLESEPEQLESDIRPGCVLLSVDLRMRSAQESLRAQDSFLRNLEAALQGGGPWSPWWRGSDMDVQLPGACLQIRAGQVLQAARGAEAPRIASVQPAAWWASPVALVVTGLGPEEFRVLCRISGSCFELDVGSTEDLGCGTTLVRAWLPGMEAGLASLEVLQNRGSMSLLSNTVTVLASHHECIAEEACGSVLNPGQFGRFCSLAASLRDIGCIIGAPPDESPPADCFARAMVASAGFGWDGTLDYLLDTAEDCGLLLPSLLEAMDCGVGILSAAVMSSKPTTIAMVLSALQTAGCATGAMCPNMLLKTTPQQLAQEMGLGNVAALLAEMDSCPDPASVKGCDQRVPALGETSGRGLEPSTAGLVAGGWPILPSSAAVPPWQLSRLLSSRHLAGGYRWPWQRP